MTRVGSHYVSLLCMGVCLFVCLRASESQWAQWVRVLEQPTSPQWKVENINSHACWINFVHPSIIIISSSRSFVIKLLLASQLTNNRFTPSPRSRLVKLGQSGEITFGKLASSNLLLLLFNTNNTPEKEKNKKKQEKKKNKKSVFLLAIESLHLPLTRWLEQNLVEFLWWVWFVSGCVRSGWFDLDSKRCQSRKQP